MRVKSCSAMAENSRPIHLSDEHGCVLRPKMISKFMKIAGADTRASVVTYAFFHAFKFPDSMAVNIKCKVRDILQIPPPLALIHFHPALLSEHDISEIIHLYRSQDQGIFFQILGFGPTLAISWNLDFTLYEIP